MTHRPADSRNELVLAIDQGGHASRALVYDRRGRQLASAHVPIETRRPGPNRVEHDADALDASVARAIGEAMKTLGDDAIRVTRAGLATQRSSIVCWDKQSGVALTPVISWQDLRAADTLTALDAHAGRIRRITGLRLSGHYGASKLRWCLDNVAAVRRARSAGTLAAGPLAAFLLFRRLAQQPLMVDTANASRTLLCDVRAAQWSDDLLELFGVPRDILPAVVPNASAYGTLRAGDNPGIELAVCTGDQTAALFAAGRPNAGDVLVNIGTGAFVQLVTGAQPVPADGLLEGVAWRDADGATVDVVEGTVNGAGSAVTLIAGELGIGADALRQHAAEWLRETEDPPLFINGVSGLAAPFWRSDIRSSFVGDGSPEQKLVAVYESIAFLIQANLDAMAGQPVPPRAVVAAGGLSRIDPLCQRIADLSGLPLRRPQLTEATARGLAYLTAGHPAAWEVPGSPDRFLPGDNAPLRSRYQRWRSALARVMAGRPPGGQPTT